jgi:hypothetical protein
MNVSLRSICLIPLLLFAVGCGSRKIEGTITDQDGHPVEKAEVSLMNAEGTDVAPGKDISSTTGTNGHYLVSSARGKPYSIIVEAVGFQTIERKIGAGEPNPVNFTLHGHAFKVGDHVRLLYPGWCPGTVTAVGPLRTEGMYSVKLDDQSHFIKSATTVWQGVGPLGDAPAHPEPCSLFQYPPSR